MQKVPSIHSYEKGVMFMMFSSIGISLFALFSKFALASLPLAFMVLVRFFVPLILFTPFFFGFRVYREINRKINYFTHVLRAIFVVICQFSLFYYLSLSSLLNAVMLWNTSPIFIPIISRVFFGHKNDRITWVSVFIGLIGVVCILKPDSSLFDIQSFWGLLAGVTMALSQVLYGYNRTAASSSFNTFILYLLTSILCWIILILSEVVVTPTFETLVLPVLESGVKPYIFFAMIAIGTIINQLLRGQAYSYSKPAVLAPFIYMSVFFSGILDYIFFDNLPDFLFIIGAILIVCASSLKMIIHAAKRRK